MENQPKNTTETLDDVVRKVQSIILTAANKNLVEQSALKAYVIKRYSNFDALKKEHKFSLGDRDLHTIDVEKKLEEMTTAFEDKTFFIEQMQMLKEKEDTADRREQRIKENPLADEEELKVGAYREDLESQVSDAVFKLQKKGYDTFESGFREGRNQYIGMYNKDIAIPESIIEYFKEKSFTVSLVEKEDRAIINLLPLKDEPVLLEEWKVIWDDFVDKMPVVESTISSQEAPIHSFFRKKQQAIRDGKNVYLGYGTAYVDGKVVSMDDGSFKERYFKK